MIRQDCIKFQKQALTKDSELRAGVYDGSVTKIQLTDPFSKAVGVHEILPEVMQWFTEECRRRGQAMPIHSDEPNPAEHISNEEWLPKGEVKEDGDTTTGNPSNVGGDSHTTSGDSVNTSEQVQDDVTPITSTPDTPESNPPKLESPQKSSQRKK